MPSALRRQALPGRSAALLALIAALSIFLAYAPTAQAQVSNVARLSALTLHSGGQPLTLDPIFSDTTTAYTATVDSSVPWLTVTPTAMDSGTGTTADPGATITVNTPVLSAAIPVDSGVASPLLLLNTDDEVNPIEISPAVDGANPIAIEVTAADGTTQTYTVTVSRPNPGCNLSNTGIQTAQTRLLAECATLLGLKDELVGSGTDLNWATTVNISSWEGITAPGDGVTKIRLTNKGLAGVIPPELGSLTNLTQLYLDNNQLTGSIPPELDNLTNLTNLYLDSNQLTNAIPSQLGSLSNLTQLYLNNNQLDDSIPPALGNLSNLTQLYLNNNQLADPIPPALGNLSNLTQLYLNNNQLDDSIPPALGNLSNLTQLYLNNNQLADPIPPALGNLSNLTQLYLNSNQLTSGIPTQLGSLTSLTHLYLSDNNLTSVIPPELGSLTNLTHLYLSDNLLSSNIPAELGDLTNLQELDLSNNQLTRAIPPKLGELSNLLFLSLHSNRLTGAIPVDLGDLTDLDTLWLHCNRLTGGIPTELAALDGNLDDGLWLQGNPLNSVAIPTGLTADKVRLSGAQGIWTAAVWCGPPAFADDSATRTVADGTASGQAIGDPVEAADPDNLPIPNTQPLTYTLGGTDASHFAIDSATGQLSVGSAALDYGNPADANTDNDYELTVTASDGVAADDNGGSDTIPVTVTVTPTASNDATLSGLTISAGALAPAFTSAGITYTASVGNSVTGVTVTPTANHAGATITVNTGAVTSGSASGSQSLNVGSNTITIIVTAENGDTKTYTVTVTRVSTDATLSDLTISAGTLSPTFVSGTIAYAASVGNSVSGVTVTPTANHTGATIKVAGTTVTSGDASGSQSLNVGANAIAVEVTAQDGSTKKTYTVTVTRAASTDATLSGLTISAGTLAPTFTSNTLIYSASVPNSVSGVTVTPTANHSGATIRVAIPGSGSPVVASGQASPVRSLVVGLNTVRIVVTAEDDSTRKVYDVKFTRAAAVSNDATLSGLTISAGALAPAFTSAGITYTASVGNSVSGVTVTPTANHSGATITVAGTTVTSGSASGSQSLNVGSNTITIIVTAENGDTKTYTVTVTRAAAPAKMSAVVKMGDDDDYEPEWGGIKGAAAAGYRGITLNWREPTGGTVKGYRILRREAGFTAYVEIHDTLGDTDPDATTYTDPLSSAESSKDYMYRVKAVATDCQVGPDWYAGDGSGWPNRKNFGRAIVDTHSTPQAAPTAPAAAPAAPQMGNGTDAAGSNNGKTNGATAGSSGITVTWQAPTNAGSGATVKGYVILRREDGERASSETALENGRHLAGSHHKYREIHTTLGDANPTATTYTDSAAVSGTTYLYRVRAINTNCYISPDPTRHDQTGYSFGDNNFGKATAQ